MVVLFNCLKVSAASKDVDGRDEPGHDDAEGEVEPKSNPIASRVELARASG